MSSRSSFVIAISLTFTLIGAVATAAGEHFRTLPAVAFQAISGWDMTGLDAPGHFSRYCDLNPLTPDCSFVADADLPHGATIVGLEIDACDSSTYWDVHFELLKVNTNEFLSGGTEAHEVEITGVAAGGCTFTTAEPQVRNEVNQFAASYVVAVSMRPYTYPQVLPCGGLFPIPCAKSSTRFNAVRLFYEPNEAGVVEPTRPLSTVLFP